MACGFIKVFACPETLAEQAVIESNEDIGRIPRKGIVFGSWRLKTHIPLFLVLSPCLGFITS